MPSYNDAEKYYKMLQKKGQAEIVIELNGEPNDGDFATNPPSCRVTVIALNNDGIRKEMFQGWKEITVKTPRDDRTFVIPVETIRGRFARWLDSTPLPTFVIRLILEPVESWSKAYDRTEREIIDVPPGRTLSIAVSLKRKAVPEPPKPARRRHPPFSRTTP